jgi:hypothetical protein
VPNTDIIVLSDVIFAMANKLAVELQLKAFPMNRKQIVILSYGAKVSQTLLAIDLIPFRH